MKVMLKPSYSCSSAFSSLGGSIVYIIMRNAPPKQMNSYTILNILSFSPSTKKASKTVRRGAKLLTTATRVSVKNLIDVKLIMMVKFPWIVRAMRGYQ